MQCREVNQVPACTHAAEMAAPAPVAYSHPIPGLKHRNFGIILMQLFNVIFFFSPKVNRKPWHITRDVMKWQLLFNCCIAILPLSPIPQNIKCPSLYTKLIDRKPALSWCHQSLWKSPSPCCQEHGEHTNFIWIIEHLFFLFNSLMTISRFPIGYSPNSFLQTEQR